MPRLSTFKLWPIPAILALAILALGIPQTADSIFRLSIDEADDVTGKTAPASPSIADANALLLEKIDGWLGDPRARIRAGILHLRLGLTPDSGAVLHGTELADAVGDLDAGLARAPGDAFAWAALAEAQLTLGNLDLARRALRASMLFAGDEPGLTLWRSALGLQLLLVLSEDDRALWANQVRLAWDQNPSAILAIAREGNSASALKNALTTDPVRLDAFEKALAAQH